MCKIHIGLFFLELLLKHTSNMSMIKCFISNYFIGVILFALSFQSCSASRSSDADNCTACKDVISYVMLVQKMEKYDSNNSLSGKERLAIYAMTFINEGLNSGKILKKELNKYTYLFELKVREDGRLKSVTIQNPNHEDANEKYFIDYLKCLPRCEFWDDYSGIDKDAVTSIIVPVRF